MFNIIFFITVSMCMFTLYCAGKLAEAEKSEKDVVELIKINKKLQIDLDIMIDIYNQAQIAMNEMQSRIEELEAELKM